jgi:DNA-binding NtrC family response regulator
VRIIAATNRDLKEEVKHGRFRLDLFYRLNVVSFETLALRERTDEIEPLADHFLERLAKEQGLPRKRLSQSAIAALKSYAWPGNIRELQNVLERAAIFTMGNIIDVDAFPPVVEPANPCLTSLSLAVQAQRTNDSVWSTLDDVERDHIDRTLIHTFYNQSAAARLLNIDRASLARKIQRYGIPVPESRRGRPSQGGRPR